MRNSRSGGSLLLREAPMEYEEVVKMFEVLLDTPWALDWFVMVEAGIATMIGLCVRQIIREIKGGARK